MGIIGLTTTRPPRALFEAQRGLPRPSEGGLAAPPRPAPISVGAGVGA
jgi:hypothetical protein